MGDVGETKQRAQLSLLDRIVVPIVIGVLAFAASLLAANISNNGAAENQRAQLEVERQKEDRARKYEVYLGFTEAVFAYSAPFRATIDCLRVQPSKAESCIDTLKAAQEPRRELRNTFNKVVVFGSDQANQAGFRLYRSLVTFDDDQISDTDTPQPIPPTNMPGEIAVPPPHAPEALPKSVGVDWTDLASTAQSAYAKAYPDFVRVMCAELPAVPRSSC